jgi:hypothetical protein
MLKKDNIVLGIIIGLVLPGLFYAILSVAALFIKTGPAWTRPFEPDKMMLLAVFINLLPIRLYFVNWKFDKTGRGVLIITFILVIAFFLFKRYI